jgi:hypothetical protein
VLILGIDIVARSLFDTGQNPFSFRFSPEIKQLPTGRFIEDVASGKSLADRIKNRTTRGENVERH